MTKSSFIAVALGLGMSTTTALADGDITQGEKVFQRCVSCHSVTEKSNKGGPYLLGIVGRPVATAEGYTYSKAMWDFHKTGAVWDEATLDAFLKAPADLVKGTNMTAPPVRRDTERADLIAFLKSKM
jgi:cytochrome c